MEKIPTLFIRSQYTHQVENTVNPEAKWVVAGEGFATRKYDGTACLIRKGKLYKRREVIYRYDGIKQIWFHNGPLPTGFEPTSEIDKVTGKQQGWAPIGPEDKWHNEVMCQPVHRLDGTYELCGPKIQGNPEGFNCHLLIRHGSTIIEDFPRTFKAIRDYLARVNIEGVVWWHTDGRMVKIKGKDFGIRRR